MLSGKGFRSVATLVASITMVTCASNAVAATIEVVKSPYCGCCDEWVEHVRKAGFAVKVMNVEDVGPVAERLGVPEGLRSCHTARAGNYVIEGHVPASDIKRLLREKPKAIGIAVPGMPAGSPGMDSGSARQPYRTMLFSASGARVFASH